MNNEISLEIVPYSDLIGLIYESAYDAKRWPELMQALEMHVLSSSLDMNEAIIQGQLLEPHFIRAVKIDQRISALQSRNVLFNKVLNQLPLGIIIANSGAKVLTMNERAQGLSSLYVVDGVLKTHSHKKTETLKKRILACAHGVLETHKHTLFIEGKNEKQHTSLWIAPTEHVADKAESRDEKCVALYLSSPMIQPKYNVDVIRHEFKLTLAEAQLVKQLINGCHNLNDAAKNLRVSVHTVRTQIKVIFEKTETHGQMELVKKILTNPAILFGETTPPKPTPLTYTPSFDASNSITLSCGRSLGFTQHGNPQGEPLIYCHALIHTDKQLIPNSTLEKHSPFNILCPRRPGFLGSSWAGSKYSLKNHAQDVIQLADYLGIDTFEVAGYSNGTPYAAALAYYYPNRVSKLRLIATMVPPRMDRLDLLSTTDRLMLYLGQWLPASALTRISYITLKSMKKRPKELVERNANKVSPHERQILQSPELLVYLKTWVDESYPDRAAGVAQDLMVRVRPWGFDTARIQVPVEIWHAKDDSTVNIRCVKQWAKTLPNCSTHWLKMGGHYIFFTQFNRLLKA